MPGPRARDLEREPLSAWFAAAITLLGYGLLDGFQRGWRKVYVELLDAGAGPILAAILKVGGQTPLTAIEELAWEQVASSYGCALDGADERRHTARLVTAMMTQFVDLGAVAVGGGNVVLTGLGSALASAADAMSSDDEDLDQAAQEQLGSRPIPNDADGAAAARATADRTKNFNPAQRPRGAGLVGRRRGAERRP